MKYRILALLGAMLLSLTACTGGGEKVSAPPPPVGALGSEGTQSTPSATPTPSPSPAPAPQWGEQVSECEELGGEEGDVLLVEGHFSLPHIDNADGVSAYEAINDHYLDLSAALRSDTLANAPQASEDYALSQSMDYPFSHYSDEETFEIKWESGHSVSILRTHYGYTGGVYPTLLYMADHFDLTTGAPLSFADFFPDADAAERTARAALEEQRQQAQDGEEAAALQALLDNFRRENFYLTGDAVVFFTQPDRDTPHAAGAVEGAVPLERFGDLMTNWS